MRLASALLAAATFCAAPAANAATIVADFELNGSLANAAGTAATLTNGVGGVLGATGITFAVNGGPTISGLGVTSTYTIDTVFSFDALSGYRKIVDFRGLTADAGLYDLNGSLNFYPIVTSPSTDFTVGTPTRVTFSRDATGTMLGYINGTQVFSAIDPTGLSTISSVLTFFVDDLATGSREASGGFVDYIRIYDGAILPAQALPVSPVGPGAVPEPATWAMMVLGFAMLGAVTRRRAKVQVRYA